MAAGARSTLDASTVLPRKAGRALSGHRYRTPAGTTACLSHAAAGIRTRPTAVSASAVRSTMRMISGHPRPWLPRATCNGSGANTPEPPFRAVARESEPTQNQPYCCGHGTGIIRADLLAVPIAARREPDGFRARGGQDQPRRRRRRSGRTCTSGPVPLVLRVLYSPNRAGGTSSVSEPTEPTSPLPRLPAPESQSRPAGAASPENAAPASVLPAYSTRGAPATPPPRRAARADTMAGGPRVLATTAAVVHQRRRPSDA